MWKIFILLSFENVHYSCMLERENEPEKQSSNAFKLADTDAVNTDKVCITRVLTAGEFLQLHVKMNQINAFIYQRGTR